MIGPQLDSPEIILPFLDAHIHIDLQHIAECCAESTDGCILLLHRVINHIATGQFYLFCENTRMFRLA